jgi:capsular exopolysaccharide synthesis family protein
VVPDAQSLDPKRLRSALAVFSSNPTDRLVDHPLSAFAESFRNLRAFLTFAAQGDDVRLIAVTSAMPREGKSVTAFGLARTLALTGARVVLVDCDLRQRGSSRMAEPCLVDGKPVGLVEVIQGDVPLAAALARDSRTNLAILPASGRSAPVDLFSTPQSDALLRDLADHFDYVILDTPPLLGVADARILAAKVDRVLYVVHWNKTSVRAAQAAVDILHESGATVAGAALTRVDVSGQARFGYGDDSDYYGAFKRYYVEAA